MVPTALMFGFALKGLKMDLVIGNGCTQAVFWMPIHAQAV